MVLHCEICVHLVYLIQLAGTDLLLAMETLWNMTNLEVRWKVAFSAAFCFDFSLPAASWIYMDQTWKYICKPKMSMPAAQLLSFIRHKGFTCNLKWWATDAFSLFAHRWDFRFRFSTYLLYFSVHLKSSCGLLWSFGVRRSIATYWFRVALLPFPSKEICLHLSTQ